VNYPGSFARTRPDHPAVVMAESGRVVTYRELDERSNQLAHLLRQRGLRRGDHVAIFAENHERFLDALWAAARSGLYFTPVNAHLTADEASYIVDDCDAQALITSSAMADVASAMVPQITRCRVRLAFDSGGGDGTLPDGFESLEVVVARYPSTPIADESQGTGMFYSSGTTGRPKGILPPLPDAAAAAATPVSEAMRLMWGIGPDTVYLSPAPLYHTSPSNCCMGVQRYGGTAVIMEQWDPEAALRAIERYRVTTAQFVPTMFVRMLKLPGEVRDRYDTSTLDYVLHTAAPCAVEIKQQMLDWWGPIIHEVYAASENPGYTAIGPEEWLQHRGSVGQAQWGVIHIVDDDGRECPRGEPGVIYFENPLVSYEYHKDPGKSSQSRHRQGWWSVGDMGYLDDDGYLFLTDRQSHMIISGGVNIYPQEIENLLITHPMVLDVAVIGVPDNDRGELVKAIVQTEDRSLWGADLEAELLAFCRAHLARYKCPRSVDFVDELPRLPTGKLYKRLLKDRYWGDRATRIV
jgi:acyl-CoA synthetase (AMP-forming)/AMP-acid ligase II